MQGLSFKPQAQRVIDRVRRLLTRQMLDGVLATLPVQVDVEDQWQAFEKKWGTHPEGQPREFPCNEEIFDRTIIGLAERGKAHDDQLPVVYSMLDAGEGLVGAVFGLPTSFYHRPRAAVFSASDAPMASYDELSDLRFDPDGAWAKRFLDIEGYFRGHMAGRFTQHPSLTMDALNFVVEIRGATTSYLDINMYPDELRRLMDIGLDFNIRFQEAQMAYTGSIDGGCLCWLAGWTPFPRCISFSVDAYVIVKPAHYVEFGFDWQRRLIEHFGHGVMHFHCNRTDLAAEVAKLPNLMLFQYGGDPHDPKPDWEYLPDMRRAVGDIPLQVCIPLDVFRAGLHDGTLPPNVWYQVCGSPVRVDEANRLMDEVWAYRA